MKFSRYVPHKRKIPPTQRSDDFVGVNRRQNESGVLRGGKNLHREQILATLYFSTKLVGFAIKGITVCKVRQDGFAKFIVIKR